MGYYTFLLVVEATVEGPDAGEAADTLSQALRQQAGLLYGGEGQVIGYLHDTEPYGRWWRARPVEAVVIERENAKRKRRKQR